MHATSGVTSPPWSPGSCTPRESPATLRSGPAPTGYWTNRQSGRSAVRDSTTSVLIVAEALHDSAPSDVRELTAAIAGELAAVWSVAPASAVLTPASPQFTFGA